MNVLTEAPALPPMALDSQGQGAFAEIPGDAAALAAHAAHLAAANPLVAAGVALGSIALFGGLLEGGRQRPSHGLARERKGGKRRAPRRPRSAPT